MAGKDVESVSYAATYIKEKKVKSIFKKKMQKK